jgi:integrase
MPSPSSHQPQAAEPYNAADSPKLRERVERGIYKRKTRDGQTRYEVAYLENGRQRWATVAKLQEARDLRADLVSKINRGEKVTPSKIALAELAETWYAAKATRLRPRTAAYYRRALDLVVLPRFGSWRVEAVDADAIAKLIRDLEREGLHAVDPSQPVRPLGRSSVENYLKPLQGTLALAVRRPGIAVAANPFDALTKDERPARGEKATAYEWRPEDVEALLAASARIAAKHEARRDYTGLLRLVARLGLRLGEVLGLQWWDFRKDEDGGVLYVRRQWLRSGEYGPPKTAAGARRIVLPADLREELIGLRLASGFSQDGHPVFASREGTPLGHRNVTRRGFEAAALEAKLVGVSFHDLRHAAASRLIRGGLDPVTVANVLGHEDANTTLRVYGHLYDRRRTDESVRVALAASERAPHELLR